MHTFHRGPPPIEVGWMLTRIVADFAAEDNRGDWRWWDGVFWSCLAEDGDDLYTVAACARSPSLHNGHIQWSLYYPPNARVPESEARVFKDEI